MRLKFFAVFTVSFTVGIVSAFASSADAVVFTLSTKACSGGANVALCYESVAKEKLEFEVEQSITIAGGGALLVMIRSPEVAIFCKKSSGSGTIAQKEPLAAGARTDINGLIVTYEECEATGAPVWAERCTVPTSKATNKLKGELLTASELLVKPETGTSFIEIIATSREGQSCPADLKGLHSITGEQQVQIFNSGTLEATKSGATLTESRLEDLWEGAHLTEELTLMFPGLGDNLYISTVA
jgi:hypothetical protein